MQMTFDFPTNLTEELANDICYCASEFLQAVSFVAVANAKLGREVVIPVDSL